MEQGHALIAKSDFAFRASAKGRAVTVRKGQGFWVTTSEYTQARTGVVTIDRKGKGCIGNGYHFTPAQIADLFEVAA